MKKKKVKDKRGTEFTLIQFIVLDGKIKAILETLDGRFITTDYIDITKVK